MAKKNVYTVRGVAHWAKVLGEPVLNYQGDNREWTIDVTPDEAGIKTLTELGLNSRLKNKDDDRGTFIQFRQRQKRQDGSYNRPISVVDTDNQPWPQDKAIGNGTVVDVKFDFRDYGKGKFPGVYPVAIMILDYKPYVRQEFAPLDPSDPYYKKDESPSTADPEAPVEPEVIE